MGAVVDQELAEWQISEGCDEQSRVQLEACSGVPQLSRHLYDVNTFCFYLKYIDQYK